MKNKKIFTLKLTLALLALLLMIVAFSIKEYNIIVINNDITKVFIILLFLFSGMISGIIMWFTIIEKDSKEKKSIAIQIINNEDAHKDAGNSKKKTIKKYRKTIVKNLISKLTYLMFIHHLKR